MPEIASDIANSHARSVVHRLIDTNYRLPDEIRDDILALGQAAVPALLEIFEDALATSPAGGWGPTHAAQLLGELHAAAAVEPMLRVLAGTEAHDRLHDKIIQVLPELGAAVTEPAIRAFADSADPTFRYSLSAVLAECQIHDDRIFEILIDQLRREPSLGAGNLAPGDLRRPTRHPASARSPRPVHDRRECEPVGQSRAHRAARSDRGAGRHADPRATAQVSSRSRAG